MADKVTRTNYSGMILEGMNAEVIMKAGVHYNTDYEGDVQNAAAVVVTVRDAAVEISDYDKLNGIEVKESGETTQTMLIDQDWACNEIIDGHDAATVPDNKVAERLARATEDFALKQDNFLFGKILAAVPAVAPTKGLDAANIYNEFTEARKTLLKRHVKNNGKMYAIVSPDVYQAILDSDKFTSASDLGDKVKETGAVGKIAGILVFEANYDMGADVIFGHPNYLTFGAGFKVSPKIVDLDGDSKYIGACSIKGRLACGALVSRTAGFLALKADA